MQNLNRIGAMKEKVLESILATQDIVRLIENKKDVVLPAFEIRYKQVFPWKKILVRKKKQKHLLVLISLLVEQLTVL